MARHDDGYGIAVVGKSHGSISLGATNRASYISVGAGLAVRDLKQSTPAFQLERCAAKVQGEGELAAGRGEVLLQLADIVPRLCFGLLPKHGIVLPRGKLAGIEFECQEALFRDTDPQPTNWRLHLRVVQRFHRGVAGKGKHSTGGRKSRAGRPRHTNQKPLAFARGFWRGIAPYLAFALTIWVAPVADWRASPVCWWRKPVAPGCSSGD